MPETTPQDKNHGRVTRRTVGGEGDMDRCGRYGCTWYGCAWNEWTDALGRPNRDLHAHGGWRSAPFASSDPGAAPPAFRGIDGGNQDGHQQRVFVSARSFRPRQDNVFATQHCYL